jgi:SAM-dependent methyltransferase
VLFGIPDLRLTGDRYLSLEADRERARELAQAAESGLSWEKLVALYWEATPGTPAAIAARHIAGVARSADESEAILRSMGRGRLLDVGCGSGGSLVAAIRSRAFDDIVGVDSALRWLVIARQRLREAADAGRVTLAAASVDALPFAEEAFDAVLLRHLLEHVESPAAAVASAARALAPEGTLGIETFHRWAPTPEPHVGLFGVAWLPRNLQRRYVAWRTGDDYASVRLPSRREVLTAIRRAKLGTPGFLVFPASSGERAALPRALAVLAPVYETLRRNAAGKRLLSHVAPILRVTAVKSKSKT